MEICIDCACAAENSDFTSFDFSYSRKEADKLVKLVQDNMARIGYFVVLNDEPYEQQSFDCALCERYTSGHQYEIELVS